MATKPRPGQPKNPQKNKAPAKKKQKKINPKKGNHGNSNPGGMYSPGFAPGGTEGSTN